ncbi:hypothetical protein AB1Y20_004328 [Prymnesium parvum]|uniref:Sulfotransferase n=1 Tax=Prymnesium parvum TaxID=97485 RepID=A0AB34IVX4_PRYPA
MMPLLRSPPPTPPALELALGAPPSPPRHFQCASFCSSNPAPWTSKCFWPLGSCGNCAECYSFHAPDNLFLASMDGSRALSICVFPKAGSTSIFYFFYEALYGAPYRDHFDDDGAQVGPWVQQKEFWPASVANLKEPPPYAPREVVYIVRDPLDRYVSAFRSKFMCGGPGICGDGERVTMEQFADTVAPALISRYGYHSAKVQNTHLSDHKFRDEIKAEDLCPMARRNLTCRTLWSHRLDHLPASNQKYRHRFRRCHHGPAKAYLDNLL